MTDKTKQTKQPNGQVKGGGLPFPRFKLTIEYLDNPDTAPQVVEANSIVLFTGEVTDYIANPDKPNIAVNMATVGDVVVNNVVLNNAPELVKHFYEQQAKEMQSRMKRKDQPN